MSAKQHQSSPQEGLFILKKNVYERLSVLNERLKKFPEYHAKYDYAIRNVMDIQSGYMVHLNVGSIHDKNMSPFKTLERLRESGFDARIYTHVSSIYESGFFIILCEDIDELNIYRLIFEDKFIHQIIQISAEEIVHYA